MFKNTCSNIKITTRSIASYKIQWANNKYGKKMEVINAKIILVLESKMLVSIIEKTLSELEVVDERLRL